MEKLKTRNEYVGCNRKCRYYADTEEAYSYGHWCFVKRINGKLIFNNYNYSHTTRRHQNAMIELLRELGIEIDAYVYFSDSLSEYSFKNNALKAFYSSCAQLIVQNNTKRVRKKTIESNKVKIDQYRKQIKKLRDMGAEYSFKQLYKQYEYYKKLRDEKEAVIKFVKVNKGKVFRHTEDKKFFQVVSRNNRSVMLFDLDGKTPSYRKYKTVYFDRFLRDYKLSPLYSELM